MSVFCVFNKLGVMSIVYRFYYKIFLYSPYIKFVELSLTVLKKIPEKDIALLFICKGSPVNYKLEN